MKGMKSRKLFGTALLGLSLLGAALGQGVMVQHTGGARGQNFPGMTTQNEMSAGSQGSLWVQGKVGRVPIPSYSIPSSVRTRLAPTQKSAATLPLGYERSSRMLERFSYPGYHTIDYDCKTVGIVFSVNAARGAVRGEGWPGLSHLCARLERR